MVLDIVPNFDKPVEERIISYLPLSHVAGMMVDIVCPIVGAAFKEGYACNYFARPYDLKVGTIGDRLKAVKPTMFLGVPRVWEKIAEKMKVSHAPSSCRVADPPRFARDNEGRGRQHQGPQAQDCQVG